MKVQKENFMNMLWQFPDIMTEINEMINFRENEIRGLKIKEEEE